MNRRQFFSLTSSTILVSLAGCRQNNSEDGAETDTTSTEITENEPEPETSSSGGSVPGCWPSMCAGTQIIEVHVNSGFSGTAVLEASCKDDSFPLQSGESVELVREEDGEECGVTLFIDDEPVYSERVEGHASVTLTVKRDNEVEEEIVVL